LSIYFAPSSWGLLDHNAQANRTRAIRGNCTINMMMFEEVHGRVQC